MKYNGAMRIMQVFSLLPIVFLSISLHGMEITTRDGMEFKIPAELRSILIKDEEISIKQLQCCRDDFASFCDMAKRAESCKSLPNERDAILFRNRALAELITSKNVRSLNYCAITFNNQACEQAINWYALQSKDTLGKLVKNKTVMSVNENQLYPSILDMHDNGTSVLLATENSVRPLTNEIPNCLYTYPSAAFTTFSPNGEWFFVVQKEKEAVCLFEKPQQENPKKLVIPKCCQSLPKAVALDNSGVAYMIGARMLAKVAEGKKSILLKENHLSFSCLLPLNKKSVVLLADKGDVIYYFNTKLKQYTSTPFKTSFPLLGYPDSLHSNDKGTQLYSVHIDRLLASDIEKQQVINQIECEDVKHAAYYEEGNMIATALSDGTVKVWDSRYLRFPVKKIVLDKVSLDKTDSKLHDVTHVAVNSQRLALAYKLYKVTLEEGKPLGLVTDHVSIADLRSI